MEKTRIKISYKHDTKEGDFQIPDMMIVKEWYNSKTGNVSFAKVLYKEDKQVSKIIEERFILVQKEL